MRRVRRTDEATATPAVEQVLRSSGQPLPSQVRDEHESRAGADFSAVRVHTDPAAAASATAQQAEAYTVGSHIAFAPGRFAPHTEAGRGLLAHELTHVIQQSGAPPASGTLPVSKPADPAEQQAERAARGERVGPHHASPVMVHRAFGLAVRHSGLHGADAVIPLQRFIGYVEEVERANPNDRPADTLSRLRVQYYGGEGFTDFAKFDQLIPDAPAYDSYTNWMTGEPVYNPRGLGNVSADARDHLLARADENAVGDNPSPYLLLPNGERVDVGHLFLAMDALLHPRTGDPYSTYGVPNIDVSGWVADVGIAAVWLDMARRGKPHPDDPVARAGRPMTVDEYFRASAPDEDLHGDIDAFGLRTVLGGGGPLSAAIRSFYTGGPGAGVQTSRYAAFCSGAGIRYTAASGVVTWDAGQRPALIARIDRFNDLYGAGTSGTIWGTLFGPSHRSWPDTPVMLDKFLAWLKPRLEAELRTAAAVHP